VYICLYAYLLPMYICTYSYMRNCIWWNIHTTHTDNQYIRVCMPSHTHTHTHTCTNICIFCVLMSLLWKIAKSKGTTGWRRLIGCLKLQVIFRKRATHYRALLPEITGLFCGISCLDVSAKIESYIVSWSRIVSRCLIMTHKKLLGIQQVSKPVHWKPADINPGSLKWVRMKNALWFGANGITSAKIKTYILSQCLCRNAICLVSLHIHTYIHIHTCVYTYRYICIYIYI